MNAPLTDVGQIPMSPALAATLARAADAAKARRLPRVTLEHVLLSLCDDPDGQAVLDASRLDVLRLRWDVARFVDGFAPPPNQPPSSEPLAVAEDVSRILEAAGAAARGGRRRDIDGAIVLAAIVGDGQSHAARILEAHGLTFDAAIRALQQAISRRPAPPPIRPSEPFGTEDVLARARERIQARTTPTLSDLMPRPQSVPQTMPSPEPQTAPFADGVGGSSAPDFQSVVPAPETADVPSPQMHAPSKVVDDSAGDVMSVDDGVSMRAEPVPSVDGNASVTPPVARDDAAADEAAMPPVEPAAPRLPGAPNFAAPSANVSASASTDVPRLGTLPGWPEKSSDQQAATNTVQPADESAPLSSPAHDESEPPRHMPMLTDGAKKTDVALSGMAAAPAVPTIRDDSAARPEPTFAPSQSQMRPVAQESPSHNRPPETGAAAPTPHAPRNDVPTSAGPTAGAVTGPVAGPPPLPTLGLSLGDAGLHPSEAGFDPFAFSAGPSTSPSIGPSFEPTGDAASRPLADRKPTADVLAPASASPPEWEAHGPHVLSVQPAATAPAGSFDMPPVPGHAPGLAPGQGTGSLVTGDRQSAHVPRPSHDAGPPQQNTQGPSHARGQAPPRQQERGRDAPHHAERNPERAARTIPVGKLLARVPRKMRVGRIKPVNIRLPIAAINDALRPYQTRPRSASGFAVRLYAPDGGVYVTGDTDMIYWPGSVGNDANEPQDHVTWHFQVVPYERGQIPITMVLRAIAATGNGGIDEYDVGDDTTYVNVRSNLKRAFMKVFGWLFAFGLGIALGRHVDGFWAALHASAPSLIPPPP